MWDFFTTVRNRHSIRKYQADMPVEKEKLHAILEMVCAAPSAGDLQPYHIFVVSNAEKRIALSKAANDQEFVSEAPVCLVFCARPEVSNARFGERGKSLYALQDTTIAATYAQLASVAAGLSSTWVGYFEEQQIKEILELEDSYHPVALLCLGYPAEIPEATTRVPMEQVISYIE